MKKAGFTLTLGLLTVFIFSRTVSADPIEAKWAYQIGVSCIPADTVIDPETHLTFDILSELPLGKSVQEVSRFFDKRNVVYSTLDNTNITLKNFDLDYFIVEGVSYTFSEFTFKDLNLEKLERLSLIKDGKYTSSNPRSLRNKEKQEYDALAKSIEEKLKAKFGAAVNGYFKCGHNVKCRAVVGTAKVYDTGDDIIALYLTFELQP